MQFFLKETNMIKRVSTKKYLYTKTFNKPIKASLSDKKYPIAIQTHPTQI